MYINKYVKIVLPNTCCDDINLSDSSLLGNPGLQRRATCGCTWLNSDRASPLFRRPPPAIPIGFINGSNEPNRFSTTQRPSNKYLSTSVSSEASRSSDGTAIKAASHYPLALLLPVSLPVAIECQPTRALDVGAVIAVAWQRQ